MTEKQPHYPMRIVRVLAAIGLAISGYLLFLKLNGTITSIRGCGGSGGCENVLGSKWSQWFGIPVSAFSTLLYAGLIAVTFKSSKYVLKAIAVVLLAAALWFIGLQIFVIKSFCPWCCATHLVGIAAALAILKAISITKVEYSRGPATLVGLVLFSALVLGQIFGPEPESHRIDEDNSFVGVTPEPETSAPALSPAESRVISFQNGSKSYRVDDFPLLGPPMATHILVKYFDYTCASCLDVEGDLEKLMEKHPKDVAVLVLPTPINRACNPYLTNNMSDHQHACELARLGLAAWKAAPDQFAKVHKILFSRPVVDGPSARERLIRFIPASKLDAALADPWVEKVLKSNVEDFRILTSANPAMPKILLIDSKVLQGVARTTADFLKGVEIALGLQ
jgi:uncharacterized membrane protein